MNRDRILEQALKHELRAALPNADGAPTPVCLDAETIAAWHDGGLDAAQIEAAELHASTCPHCQAVLASVARGTTATIPAVAAQPDGFRWWRWWLAPLVAGAAAVTLWMVVPDEQPLLMRTAPAQSTVAVDATSESRAKDQPPATVPESPAFRQLDSRKRDAAADQDKKLNTEPKREDRRQLADAAAPKEEVAAAPAPLTPPAPAAPVPPPAVAVGAPAAVPMRTEDFAAGERMAELQKSSRATPGIEVFTLDRNYRWRFVANRIERTTDAGATWAIVREQPNELISAGSAPSTSVAWFVGQGGLVLLTTNGGATFIKVTIPQPLDLASVSATDARRAIVATVGGLAFRTDDGGRTWQ